MVRPFQRPGRSTAYGARGMAATSHPLATQAALDQLRQGGNAVDAALAAVAVQSVVEPHMTGIGGDNFSLIAPAGGAEIVAINGSGAAPTSLSLDGISAEDRADWRHSVHSITLPGAVSAWALMAERFGRRGLAACLAPAIRYARDGFTVTPRVAFDWARGVDKLKRNAAAGRFYLPQGRAPLAGDRVRLPVLAETLASIAARGRDGFYRGAVAERMAASLRAAGGVHTADDFADVATEVTLPIQTTYRGVTVHECPPNGQGVIALLLLNILAADDTSDLDPLGVERLHRQAEATVRAYAARNALLADPGKASVPVAQLLDPAYAAALHRDIDPTRATTADAPALLPVNADTVYIAVVDQDGMAVSLINSIFDDFGAGIACPKTGVLFHNRGASFALDPAHPNALAPGKRPLHTIIPAMTTRDGRVERVFGVMGGHYQAVGQAHVLSNALDFGMAPQTALDLPRAFAYEGELSVEGGVPEATVAGLAALGHKVSRPDKPIGGGQMIEIDHARGVLLGGSDPRKDGIALGLD